MTQRTWCLLWAALSCAASSCSGDDDASAGACPEGVDAGAELACTCDDGGAGVQVCRDDGTLGACDCTGEGGGSSGRGGSGGSGGRAGSGGSGGDGGSGGNGGSRDGGGAGDDDAGIDPTPADGGSGTDAGISTTLPTDGDQLSVCEDDNDCDMDYGCYMEGGGQHFCTALCESNDDCEDIGGADYTCSPEGQCEVVCQPNDDEDCPDGLTCLMVSGPGPGGLQFRCKYSATAGVPGAGEAYGPCSGPGDCEDGLECFGAFAGVIIGYCTHTCEQADDCSEQPSSGTLEPTCVQVAPMPGSELCVLDCADDPDGCPDGMICGLGNRCVYE